MLLKLALILSTICVVSAEIVEIECVYSDYLCRVDVFPDELPANATWKFLCPQSCIRLRMEYAKLPRFPRELWITHPRVTELHLENTEFEELTFGDFFNAAKLTTFRLKSNKNFMSLRDNCFWGAFELNTLDFYGNNISEIEGDAFNGLPLLEHLELQYNNLTHISNDHFRNLPNLWNLYLQFNTIETIESEAFLYNTKLNNLNINSNNLHEVDLLLPFINTRIISLFGNQLTKATYRSVSQEIGEFDSGAFIYLEDNKLTDLYIQPNIHAEALILWENSIERIDTLPMLRSLKLLNLQRCEIKSLDGQRFADKFVNLERLYLTDNNMTSFSKDTFAGLNKLEILDLNNNALRELDFPRLESLTTLDIMNNGLTEFPYGKDPSKDIRDSFPALRFLDIRKNDFEEEYLAELVTTLQDQGIIVSS